MGEVSNGRRGAVAMTIAYRKRGHFAGCILQNIRKKILSKVIVLLIGACIVWVQDKCDRFPIMPAPKE